MKIYKNDAYKTRNLIYIDSGNGEYTGQVVCGLRESGRTTRKSIAGMYPDILGVMRSSRQSFHVRNGVYQPLRA